MELQDLKRWHWIVLGLLAGVALAGMRLFWGPDYRQSTARTLSQEQFESGLLRPDYSLRIEALLLHPPDEDGNWWVTGRFGERKSYADPGSDNAGPRIQKLNNGPFKYMAPARYKPRLRLEGMSSGETTIRAYLDAAISRMPGSGLRYRYAWYEQKSAVLMLWGGATAVVVGGLWPTLLQMLTGEALGGRRTQPPGFNLNQVETNPEPETSAPTVQQQEMLTALNAQIQRQLEAEPARTGTAAPAMPPQVAAPIRELVAEELEAPPPAADHEKDYAGEFYPTEAHAPAKHAPKAEK